MYKKEFLEELKILGYSDYTITNYACDLNKLGNIELENIKEIVLKTLAEIPNMRSRARSYACYRKYTSWLETNGYIEKDPLKHMSAIRMPKKLLKIDERKDIDPIDIKIENYFKTKNSLYKTIIETLYQTGIRVGELSKMKLSDLKEDTILVHGKGGRERVVPISMKLVEDIRKELQKHENFPSPSQVYRITKKYAGTNPHNFRHLFASRLATKGISAFTIAALLGHSSVTISQQYIDLNSGDLKEAVEKANA